MKAGDIQIQLSASNRWWRSSEGWEHEDPDLRAAGRAPYSYRSGVLRDLQPGGLYLLRGPRRSGKSTEIKYAVADLIASGVHPRNIVHAAVDGWRAADLRTLVSGASRTFLSGVSGTRYWFLDEISSVIGDWPNVIKNLRDNDPAFAEDTVVLTGSSAARLHEVRKALAGRRGQGRGRDLDRALLPMTFADIVSAAGLSLPPVDTIPPAEMFEETALDQAHALLPYLSDLVALWEAYLRVGGFPQAVSSWLRDGDVDPAFTDTLWDVVYGDAINNARFSAPQTMTLLNRLTINLCSPMNVADLSRHVDAAHMTVKERLADLTESFLLWPCHREQGLMPKLNAQTKWYFTDPLLARLASLRGYGQEPDLTQLTQQQLGLTLARRLGDATTAAVGDHDAVLYYRSATGAEIDFVGRGLVPCAYESKYVDDERFARMHQTFNATAWTGIAASRTVMSRLERLLVLPAPILLLLLGD